MEDLTLVIPAKNESESLPYVLSDLNNFNCKKTIVMDPLDEETFEVTGETSSHGNCHCITCKKAAGETYAIIETDMTRPSLNNNYFMENIINKIPLGHIGQPEDVAGTVLFHA